MSFTYYLSFSGGIDSAYVLYLLLSQGERVLVHHTRLKNRQGRDGKEYEAVGNVLQWLKDQDLPGSYDYVESAMDHTHLPHFRRDIFIWAWQTGCLLGNPAYRHIKKVATCRHLNSYTDFEGPEQAKEDARMLYHDMLPMLAGRDDIIIVQPLKDLTKKDIIEQAPEELRKLSWSCRRPTKDGKPCHQCLTCKHIDLAHKGIEAPPYEFT